LINNTFFAIKFKFYSYELGAKVQKNIRKVAFLL